MWRPKDWENPYGSENVESFDLSSRVCTMKSGQCISSDLRKQLCYAREAGADAMLEALFKLAKDSSTKTFVVDSREVNIYSRED